MPCGEVKQTNVLEGDQRVSYTVRSGKRDQSWKHRSVAPYARPHMRTCARTVEAIEEDEVT